MATLTINRTRTLCDALLNRRVTTRGWLYDSVLVVLFSAFVALSARIAIPLPFTEVPLTGQTLAVLLTGGVLGSRRGALALLLYLVEGAIGLPVFAPSAALPPALVVSSVRPVATCSRFRWWPASWVYWPNAAGTGAWGRPRSRCSPATC